MVLWLKKESAATSLLFERLRMEEMGMLIVSLRGMVLRIFVFFRVPAIVLATKASFIVARKEINK